MTFFLFVVAEIANVAVIRGMMRCFFDVSSKVTPKEYAGYFLYYVFHLAAHLMRIETAAFSCRSGDSAFGDYIFVFIGSEIQILHVPLYICSSTVQ